MTININKVQTSMLNKSNTRETIEETNFVPYTTEMAVSGFEFSKSLESYLVLD